MFEITELPMLYNTELEFYKFETRSPLNIANISLSNTEPSANESKELK